MRRVLAVCGLLVTVVISMDGSEPLTIAVSPAFALAPATLKVRTRIEPNADNRRLTIVADGAEFYRSSEVQLEGEQAPKTIEMSFSSMPGGDYEVSAILTDSLGRQRAIARRATTILAMSDGQ
jgi:hypothetical protein